MILPKGSLLQNGKYSIEKVLGQGGFGITYLATQVGLNRKVAIKEFFMKEYCNRDEATSHVSVPSVGSVDLVAKFRQKFIKEAQTIAEMENPHIVHIYDVFEDNGTAYYAMQFVDGGCLNDLTPFTIDEAVLYIKQIADALGYCHKRKILHLDVKPANILLKDNNAVLIDFGISKHYDDQGGQTSSTPIGISKGYAPLEQYNRSDMSSFTPLTDIYSLGATLYKLITGQTPPDANYVHENGVELPDDIPFNVRNAIIKSMEPRRKDRPQSIAEFLKLLDGEGVKTQDDDEATEIVGVERPKPTEPKKEEPKQELPNEQNPKKKKSKAWIFILLAIIIGGAGYYFVNDKMKGEKKKEAEMLAQAEQERIKKEQEAAQIAQAQKEAEAKLRAEQERLEKERQELEAEKAEAEMLAQAEQERIKKEQEAAQIAQAQKEAEAKLKAEQERLEKERQELEAEKAEAEAKAKAEHEARLKAEAEAAEAERRLQEAEAERKRQEKYARTHGNIKGHEYVDLGLSVKWATCNVGANKPEDYGYYYAWGETSTKWTYSESNSKTHGKQMYDIKGKSKYDAARADWGGTWRLPTKTECQELVDRCTWKWTTQNGVNGYKVTGPNGNSIFLPAAGCHLGSSLSDAAIYGGYWSSTPSGYGGDYACELHFNSNFHGMRNYSRRIFGLSVRPVLE